MAELSKMVEFLDRELRTAEITDYPGALNGLQLDHQGPVERIIAAVDATLPVVEKAAAAGPGTLLLVHHGMFWQGAQTVTGAFYRKLKRAMEANLAIYSSHLPLDLHPRWGNNVLLARALGLQDLQPFFEFKGQLLGYRGTWQGDRDSLSQRLEEALGDRIHCCPGGPEAVHHVGVMTGGAGSEVAAVAAQGIDTFITGEGPHWSYILAEEIGINVCYGGHYATETFGVKALAQVLSEQFGCPWHFVDHPTGL